MRAVSASALFAKNSELCRPHQKSTEIDLPDDLFRQIKARAALRGQTLKELVTDALRARLAELAARPGDEPGWRRVFGKATKAEIEPVQARIDRELSRIDPETWR